MAAKPLGYRATALDALRGANLSGKVAVVTGGAIQAPRPPMPGADGAAGPPRARAAPAAPAPRLPHANQPTNQP